MPTLPHRRLNFSLALLLSCALVFSGCAGNNAASQQRGPARSAAAEYDPFSEDDAYDYLTQDGPEGQTVVGDDYFDDDGYLNDYAAKVVIPDPLEPWNRFWFSFNDILVDYAVRPINTGYEFITPAVARKGIRNFFHNLRAPVRIINCLLQGKGQKAGVEFSSFFMNTIFGFAGTVDLASNYKTVVPATGEDFGQTLGVWGVGEGIYLVWPVLGPSNLRETLGIAGELTMKYYANPINYANLDWTVDWGITALNVVSGMDDVLTAYDTLKGMAIDPYVAMRDGWTQLRRAAIAK